MKTLVAFAYLLLLLPCCGTGQDGKVNAKKSILTDSLNRLKQRELTINPSSLNREVLKLDRDSIFNVFSGALQDSLKKNKVIDFLYNECLDMDNLAYCRINLHLYSSLRKDLLDSLSQDDIRKLTVIGDSNLLKRKCTINYEGDPLPHFNESTWMLLTTRMKEINTNKR
jgi:hypothetical protein